MIHFFGVTGPRMKSFGVSTISLLRNHESPEDVRPNEDTPFSARELASVLASDWEELERATPRFSDLSSASASTINPAHRLT